MKPRPFARLGAAVMLALATAGAQAHAIDAPTGKVRATFDIVRADIKADGKQLVFTIHTAGRAGTALPARHGKLPGSQVFAYVWPTKLDPSEVGFEQGTGILALAVTAHPDFDDTPLFDENANGRQDDDGARWHSHWVVLAPDDACGQGALKVKDIPEGTTPKLPRTWPGLPLLIDSPGYSPRLQGKTVSVRVPLDRPAAATGVQFDGVTAGLRVHADLHQPLLCVEKVFDVASGDLSLPGRVE